MYTVIVERHNGKKTADSTIAEQVDYLLSRAVGGARGKGWDVNKSEFRPAYQHSGRWVFTYKLTFEKVKGQRGGEVEAAQYQEILAYLVQAGGGSKFGEYPWMVREPEADGAIPDLSFDNAAVPAVNIRKEAKNSVGIQTVGQFDKVQTWQDLYIPPDLLENNDSLSQHECFSSIYGRAPQIRTALSAIQTAIDSGGERRNHTVMWGHAACGKTSILLAIEKLLGPGAILRLDATSTTRAGLEKMFFTPEDMPIVPPIVVMEEAEKANEDALKIWLGALDQRGEIRKVNYRMQEVRQIRILFFCTVNNKGLFDRMMGSDGTEKGALSSRCVTDIYCPRPDETILRQILKRDILLHGGNEAWIDPALALAHELKTNDPRKVLSFLSGGNRLLTGEYQADRLHIHNAQVACEGH